MTRIGNIYTESFGKLPDAMTGDKKLTEMIQKEVIDKLGEPSGITKEGLADLIYAGGSCGQKCGFESGFRYALALIFESLNN